MLLYMLPLLGKFIIETYTFPIISASQPSQLALQPKCQARTDRNGILRFSGLRFYSLSFYGFSFCGVTFLIKLAVSTGVASTGCVSTESCLISQLPRAQLLRFHLLRIQLLPAIVPKRPSPSGGSQSQSFHAEDSKRKLSSGGLQVKVSKVAAVTIQSQANACVMMFD